MIIADLGSTHGNDIQYLSRAIEYAKGHDNLMLKMQAFGPDSDAAKCNVALSPRVYDEALACADSAKVTLFASAFDGAGLRMCRPPVIKFAYPMRHSTLLKSVMEQAQYGFVIVSYDWMDTIDGRTVPLLMPAPGMYPVLHKLDIQVSWFERFKGLSDHTLGLNHAMEAIDCGAQYVEKHVRFDGFYDCPDAKFAISQDELTDLLDYDERNGIS